MGLYQDTLVSVNWRTKTVAEMTLDGQLIGSFSHQEMVEPIAVSLTPQVCLLTLSSDLTAVCLQGQFVVLDTGVGVLVFDQCGNLLRKMSGGNIELI